MWKINNDSMGNGMKVLLTILFILIFLRLLLFILDKLGAKSGIDGPPNSIKDDGGPWFF